MATSAKQLLRCAFLKVQLRLLCYANCGDDDVSEPYVILLYVILLYAILLHATLLCAMFCRMLIAATAEK